MKASRQQLCRYTERIKFMRMAVKKGVRARLQPCQKGCHAISPASATEASAAKAAGYTAPSTAPMNRGPGAFGPIPFNAPRIELIALKLFSALPCAL